MTTGSVHRYRLYGRSLTSDYALPGVPAETARSAESDLTIRWCERLPDRSEPTETLSHSDASGLPLIARTRDGSHLLSWEDKIRFLLSPDATLLRVACAEGFAGFVPTVTVGIALGLVVHVSDHVPLHASVLQVSGATIAVLGRSGTGKSSFAAAMVRDGARLYSDDLAAISRRADGRHVVHRGCMGLRLYPDAASAVLGTTDLPEVPYANKLLWDLSGQPALAPDAPLDRIFVLKPDDDAERPRIGGAVTASEALPALIDNYYPPQLRRQLDRAKLQRLAELAETTPLHVLQYRRTWDQLRVLTGLLCR